METEVVADHINDLRGPADPADRPIDRDLSYADFGEQFLRRVLHLDRVLTSIDRILGEEFHLGPIGAGPTRKLAKLTAHGRYAPSYGEELPGAEVSYRVWVQVFVDFELSLPIDRHRFHAEVTLPLTVRLRLVDPVTIVWDIDTPTADEVGLVLTNDARRSAVLQRLTGIETELRGFLLRFIDRELAKPHVQRARRIPLVEVIDGAWEPIAAQFLPTRPELAKDESVDQGMEWSERGMSD